VAKAPISNSLGLKKLTGGGGGGGGTTAFSSGPANVAVARESVKITAKTIIFFMCRIPLSLLSSTLVTAAQIAKQSKTAEMQSTGPA
jgi:hypothetical protein